MNSWTSLEPRDRVIYFIGGIVLLALALLVALWSGQRGPILLVVALVVVGAYNFGAPRAIRKWRESAGD